MYFAGENKVLENAVDFDIRVRYKETDRMEVVYYGNYLTWFEVGRVEYMRAHGYSYAQMEKDGYILPVIEAHVEYINSAYFDDLLTIRTNAEFLGHVRVQFNHEIINKASGTLLARGYIKLACIDNKTKMPVRFPEGLQTIINVKK